MWCSRLFGAFLDRAAGKEREHAMMQVHTMFSELQLWLRLKDSNEIVSGELLRKDRVGAQKLKALVKEMFDMHCNTGLYALKRHLLDRVMKDWDRFPCNSLVE